MKFRFFGFLVLAISAAALVSCGSDDEAGGDVDCSTSTPTFAANVRPLFLSSGCTASGCHSGVSPQGGMNLATGDIYSAAEARTNSSNPGDSELLEKPTGDDDHPAIWSTSDTAYETVYCWIDNGAQNN